MRTILPVVFALLMQSKTAQPPKPPVTYMPFDDGDKVSANLTRPDGEGITVRKTKPPGNLHGIRAHWVREMIKTAENVN